MGTSEFMLFVKRGCAACELAQPVIRALAAEGARVYSQNDPAFPSGAEVIDDSELEQSFRNDIETVPTLIRLENGREVARTVGWVRDEWRKITGRPALGEDLPPQRPG
ncbi:MAG TPA: thioredoxin family protein [Burkholderiales bacterium]|nr:thioredoxin family protein [Burkholderiales bacterium]